MMILVVATTVVLDLVVVTTEVKSAQVWNRIRIFHDPLGLVSRMWWWSLVLVVLPPPPVC